MVKKAVCLIPDEQMKSTIVGGFKFFWTEEEGGFNILRKIRIPYHERGGDIDVILTREMEIESDPESGE